MKDTPQVVIEKTTLNSLAFKVAFLCVAISDILKHERRSFHCSQVRARRHAKEEVIKQSGDTNNSYNIAARLQRTNLGSPTKLLYKVMYFYCATKTAQGANSKKSAHQNA